MHYFKLHAIPSGASTKVTTLKMYQIFVILIQQIISASLPKSLCVNKHVLRAQHLPNSATKKTLDYTDITDKNINYFTTWKNYIDIHIQCIY